jgi:hypothetical protein
VAHLLVQPNYGDNRTQSYSQEVGYEIKTLTTARAHEGTRSVACQCPWMSTTRDARDQIKNHHQDRDRADHERLNERDYDFHDPYYDQPIQHSSPIGGHNEGGIKPFSCDLRMVRWPLNIEPPGIDMYDESSNPTKWLEGYQLTIEIMGGDSSVMANYLPIIVSQDMAHRTLHRIGPVMV